MGRNKKEQYDFSLLSVKQYSKSNALINAKGKSSLLVQKLFAIGIQQAVEDEKGILTVNIRGTDLRKLFGSKNGSFYDEIKKVVVPTKDHPSILDWRIIYSDDTTKELEAINVVTDCKFEDGIFNMRFNTKVNDQIRGLKSNYTIFSLTETMPLKSIYSFRLFELLKSEYNRQDWSARKNPDYKENDTYIIDVNLVDLKLKLGIIDASVDDKLEKALKKNDPDYDQIEEYAKKQQEYKTYQEFGQFRVKVLDKAQKEIKEKTSIDFEYEQLKNGRGGKTTGLRFFIRQKHKNVEHTEPEIVDAPPVELSPIEKYTAYFQVQTLLGTALFTMEDVVAICEAANYDMERIEAANKLMKKTKTEISNPTGWMIDAIKKGYKTVPKKAKITSNNFPQNTYDFEELENQLLDN